MNIANTTTPRTALPTTLSGGMTSWKVTENASLVAVENYLQDNRSRFSQILGDRESRAFIASVLIAVAAQPMLWECPLDSIYFCALRVAVLGLSLDPVISEAVIIPFKDHGMPKVNLVVMWKGLRTLAMNTGRYKNIHVSRVRVGEIVEQDRIFGTYTVHGIPTGENRIGWLAAFRLVDGFEMVDYWSVAKIHAHGKLHSKAYGAPFGWWKQHPEVMERKTVLRDLLSNWGPMKGSPKFKDDDDVVDADVVEGHPATFTRADYARQEAGNGS